MASSSVRMVGMILAPRSICTAVEIATGNTSSLLTRAADVVLKEYGPAKTFYNRWKRWHDKGIFIRMMEGLAAPQARRRKAIMIDATSLKAHRIASGLGVNKGSRAA